MAVRFHRASLTLEQLQTECEAVEGGIPAKLVHLQAATVEIPVNEQNRFNKAQYVEVDVLDPVPALKFVAVNDSAAVATIIADALAQHFLLIFDETLFIRGEEQRVLGFGKT